MTTSAQKSIVRQRDTLSIFLQVPLTELANTCAEVWPNVLELEEALHAGLTNLYYCDHLFAMNLDGIQITAHISSNGRDSQFIGTDCSHKPYMSYLLPASDFILSEAYISEFKKLPSITAVQLVKCDDEPVGFISAHFSLRDLPITAALYDEPKNWRQMKGDPSIRSGLFLQQHIESALDQHIETVIAVIDELIVNHGIFHCEIHFSSNRATVWSQSDPYRYRILAIEELIDPDVCLTFPRTDYPDSAEVTSIQIRQLLESFRDLRFVDETIYLRIASLNIYNGLIGLTFSCDGSHSITADEFLDKGLHFWVGCAVAGTSTVPGITDSAGR